VSDIRVQNRLLLPQRQALDLAAVAKTMASVDLSGLYPQNELWEITVVRGQSRYDVRNAVGGKMAKVPAVGPAANRLVVGQVAVVGYYDRDRRRPYIKAAGGFANWGRLGVTILDWVHSFANPGLTRAAAIASDFPGFGTSDTENLWDYTGQMPLLLARYTHTSLGPCFVVAYIGSGEVKAELRSTSGTLLASETVASISEDSPSGDFARNHQGAVYPTNDRLLIVSQFEQPNLSKTAYRKILGGDAAEGLTSDRKWLCSNFLNDVIFRGDYRKVWDLSQSSTYPTVPDTITFTASGAVKSMEVWKGGDSVGTVDANSANSSGRARVVPLDTTTDSAWAISPEQNRAAALVGLGIGLAITDAQDVAMAYGFAPASVINPSGSGTCFPGNYDGLFRTLEACVILVNLATASSTSILLEQSSHSSPAADSALTSAWSSYVQANPTGGFAAPGGGITYTWSGQPAARSIATNLWNNTLPLYDSTMTPDYCIDVRPIGLPLASRVSVGATAGADVRQIFHWESPPSTTRAGTVEHDSVTYAAWLHPHSYLGAGGIGESNSLVIRNAGGDSVDGGGIPYYDWLNYYMPQQWRHWKRKLVAIRDGAVFATADLTQYLKIRLTNPNTGSELESTESYGLPDNIWAVVPVGRLVIVILDRRHDNEPTGESVPWAVFLRRSDLTYLGEFQLYSGDTLESDVLEDPEDEFSPIRFAAGSLRWNYYTGPRLLQIRAATAANDGREWCVIGCRTEDRANSDAVVHRLIRLDFSPTDITASPSFFPVEWAETDDPSDLSFPINEEWDSAVIADNRLTWATNPSGDTIRIRTCN